MFKVIGISTSEHWPKHGSNNAKYFQNRIECFKKKYIKNRKL